MLIDHPFFKYRFSLLAMHVEYAVYNSKYNTIFGNSLEIQCNSLSMLVESIKIASLLPMSLIQPRAFFKDFPVGGGGLF